MNTKNIIILAVVFGMLIFNTFSWATVSLPLMTANTHPNASGTASFSEDGLSIKAKGQRPSTRQGIYGLVCKYET